MNSAKWQLRDSVQRYGTVSRLLHWTMAAVLAWQFASALAHWLLHDTAIEEFLWRTHKIFGVALLGLVVVRGLWALYNRSNRPPSLSIMARLGHAAMYALMVLVPVVALVRQYGSGREFAPLGIPLMPGFDGEKIEWMTALGNLLHSWLGWALLLLIVGHIAMVVVHRRRAQDEDVLRRMFGNR